MPFGVEPAASFTARESVQTSPVSGNKSSDSPLSRKELEEGIKKRFYVNEQGVYVDNGLSTSMVCFPSDFNDSASLSQIIRDSMTRAVNFIDIPVFNHLQNIPAHLKGFSALDSQPLALGLYLYEADQFSEHSPDATFLSKLTESHEANHAISEGVDVIQNQVQQASNRAAVHADVLGAMQEAHAGLNPIDDFDSAELLSRAISALRLVGLAHSKPQPQPAEGDKLPPKKALHMTNAEKALFEWYEKGEYTINGERHYIDEKGKVHGSYAILGQKIGGLHKAISFALANKKYVCNLSDTKAHDMIKELAADGGDMEAINSRIAAGMAVREQRMRSFANHTMGRQHPMSSSEAADVDAIKHGILSLLPDEALEIFLREKFRCAYSATDSVGGSYPKGNVGGQQEKYLECLRKGRGLKDGFQHIIYISHGKREECPGDVEKDPDLRNRVVALSLMHEIMHMAMKYMPAERLAQIKEDIRAIHNEMTDKVDDGGVKRPSDPQLPLGQNMTKTALEIAQLDLALYNHDIPAGQHKGRAGVSAYRGVKEEEIPAGTEKSEQIDKPKEQVREADKMVGFFKLLKTMNTRNLTEVLDYNSNYYVQYEDNMNDHAPVKRTNASNSSTWEEVACNVAGLMFTEEVDPDHYLKSLQRLQQHIREGLTEAVVKCREVKPLPSAIIARQFN